MREKQFIALNLQLFLMLDVHVETVEKKVSF